MQESVSPFYSSATDLQYVNPTFPMDGRIVHSTTSYSASYSQPSYATPHISNFSAPYATVDVHNSAPHLHGHSRISEKNSGVHMPSSNIVAYDASSTQLHNFGNISLPKESESIAEQSLPEVIVAALIRAWHKTRELMLFALNNMKMGCFLIMLQ